MVIFAPRFCGAAASDALIVLVGCTANTNSKVGRTPSGRNGKVVKISISLGRIHAGA